MRTKPDSPPESLPEQRKRRRERVLLALTLIMVVAITSLEVHLVHQGGQPVSGSLMAFGLLNVNAILLLLFTFLVFRHLTKLFLERRRQVFGSRLRIRLVLAFITLTMLPTLFLFFMAWQLISSRVDYTLDRQVQESLERALVMSQLYAQETGERLQAYGRLLTYEMKDQKEPGNDAWEDFLAARRAEYQVSGLEMLQPDGTRLYGSYAPELSNLPEVPWPRSKKAASPVPALLRQKVPQGEILSILVPWRQAASGALQGYLAVRQLLPRSQLLEMADAARGFQNIRQHQLLFSPMRVSHYLALVIVTLVTLMGAVWLAFYMTREITTPIRELAAGALKVAGGVFDVRIAGEGRDEIGFLVQSFNKMTQDLQRSQAQLDDAYRQLSASHALISTQKRDMEILLKNVAAGVIGVDAAGRVTIINDSAAQMLHLKREAVLGQDSRALLPPAEYNRLAEVVASARRSPRGTVEKPLHLTLPDQTLYLLLKPTVLKDEAGHDLGVVMVFEDLTELERAQRLATWREVARRIAHEVKNPLTPIKLAAQRLQRRYGGSLGEDEKIFQECTQIIVSQVDELKNLVNEFSRFARLPNLALAPQDLNALVKETLALYQEVQPRVTLEFRPDPSLAPILLDREQIKRLLLNLLDNALASITGAGGITVSVQGREAPDWVELTVSDTGRGVPDRDKVRIFEPYFSTKRGGTGLGLAIVNSIVAEHQGRIRVEDNFPRGTRFIIEIPIHRALHDSNVVGS
jgi:two-component system nitrogen regulation sensor histidine kinase NtrY